MHRRSWIILSLGLLAIVVSVITLAILPHIVKRIASTQIRAATGRDVTIQDVNLNLFTRRIAVKKFALADKGSSEPFVQFEHLEAHVRFLPLLKGHIQLAELDLRGPTVRLVRTGPRAFNFSDLLTPQPASKSGPLGITIDRFQLTEGTLVLKDLVVPSHQTWQADNLSIESKNLSTTAIAEEGTATIAFAVGKTPIALTLNHLRFVPTNASIAIAFQGFGLKSVLPYLEQQGRFRVEGDSLSAQLTVDYGEESGILMSGDVDIEKVHVFRQGQDAPFVSVPHLKAAVMRVSSSRDGILVKHIELTGQATVIDADVTPLARFNVDGIKLTFDNATWPWQKPAPVTLAAGLPNAGRLSASGTIALDPLQASLRAVMEAVDLTPYQSYLPLTVRAAGAGQADLTIAVSGDAPMRINVEGHAGVKNFTLGPVNRPLLTIPSVNVAGIVVNWPSQIAAKRITLKRLSAVVDRDTDGGFQWQQILKPTPAPHGTAPTKTSTTTGTAATAGPAQVIVLDELYVEEGSLRFTDRSTSPSYSEELSALSVRVKGLNSASRQESRVMVQAVVGSGGALDLKGAVEPFGKDLFVDLGGTLTNFAIPSTNPYMDRVLSWIARGGALTTNVHYHIEGGALEASNEITVDDLRVARASEDDIVQRRIGLPLGLLVDLMKDVHGKIHVSLPISGTLSAPNFSFSEAIWNTVRNTIVKLIAAPFKLIGKLFTGNENKIETIKIEPIRFEPGTVEITPDSQTQLTHLAEFLRGSPSIRLSLSPVISRPDVESLKTQRIISRAQERERKQLLTELSAAMTYLFMERFPKHRLPKTMDEMIAALRKEEEIPEDAVQALNVRRVKVASETLLRLATVPPERLVVSERYAGIGAAGDGRVEFAIAY